MLSKRGSANVDRFVADDTVATEVSYTVEAAAVLSLHTHLKKMGRVRRK